MLDFQTSAGILVALVICYFIFGRKYRFFLMNNFRYDYLGLPTLLAIAGPFIKTMMAWAGFDPERAFNRARHTYDLTRAFMDNPDIFDDEAFGEAFIESTTEKYVSAVTDPTMVVTSIISVLTDMLIYATPGVILAALVCLIKTRKISLTMINIPLIYIIAVGVGSAAAIAVIAIFVFIIMQKSVSHMGSITRGTDEGGICPN
ncbi:MAG: hypothetical protein FWC09_02865, partial [Lachnospiraceae bacterium]|nr:hypothetical protein [Lachnospiraceae bacterium]